MNKRVFSAEVAGKPVVIKAVGVATGHTHDTIWGVHASDGRCMGTLVSGACDGLHYEHPEQGIRFGALLCYAPRTLGPYGPQDRGLGLYPVEGIREETPDCPDWAYRILLSTVASFCHGWLTEGEAWQNAVALPERMTFAAEEVTIGDLRRALRESGWHWDEIASQWRN